MAQVEWVGGSGSWNSGSSWSTGGTPGNTDQVYIEVPGITVTVDAGVAAAAETLNTLGSTLDIGGGSLSTIQNAIFQGNFIETAGTFTMSGYGASFYDAMTFTGGTIDDLSGAVTLNDGGILAGTLAGAGGLDIVDGSAYIETGFSTTIDSIVVGANGGKLGLEMNFAYAKNFTLLNQGVLDLFGHTLTLSGPSTIDGVVGFGTLLDTGTMTLDVLPVLDNGLVLEVKGTALQQNNVAMGANDSGAKITVEKTGTYDIQGNYSITNPASVASISNSGTFAKTFGGKSSVVSASFVNGATGVLAVDVGSLVLNGLVNTLNGTVSGAGTLGIAGGQTTFGSKVVLSMAALDQQSGVLVLNKALSYGGEWDMTGGVLNLNAKAANLTLSGQADLDGGTLTGFGGSLTVDGSAHLAAVTIGGPITLNIFGTVDQTGSIGFGESSNPTANIKAGATWSIEGDSAINGFYGVINNAGLFIDPNGSGDALVQASVDNTGTIKVNNSTLTLGGWNTLGGTLTGSGLLDLNGSAVNATTTLESGVILSVAQLAVDDSATYLAGNISFANTFIEDGNLGLLELGGHTFTASGAASLDSGTLSDAGTFLASGTAVVGNYTIAGGATLEVTAGAEQTGYVTLNGGNIDIGAHGSYAIDDDLNILVASQSSGNVVNAGVLTASGTGTTQIGAALANTGSLVVSDQLLQLGGGGTLGGTISGAGTLELSSFVGGSNYELSSSAALTVSSLWLGNAATLTLAGTGSYGGLFEVNDGEISLSGQSLSVSGTTSITSGELYGPGVMTISGSGTLGDLSVSNGATLVITSATQQSSTIYVGDKQSGVTPPSTAELSVAAGATYTLDANSSIDNNGTLAVAGTLTASGDGTSTIGATIVDTGIISANLGTLEVLGAVGGTGVFSIGTLGQLQFANTATISASNFVSFATGGGGLALEDPANFAATLENFSKGDEIGLAGFNASSLTGTYANNAHTAVTFFDADGDSTTLTFSTAQTLSNFTYGSQLDNLATITHT